MLEANIIKQTEMKEKIRREYLKQMRKLLKTKSSVAEIFHQKNKHLDGPPCTILKILFKMDKGRTPTNRTEDKKVVDDAKGLTSER